MSRNLHLALTSALAIAFAANPTVARSDSTEQLLERTNTTRGICVVVGDASGELAIELAVDSQLLIYTQLPSAEHVSRVRLAARAAGLDATRLQVDQGDPGHLHLADNVADALIAVGETGPLSEAEMTRVVRPGGLVIVLEFTTPPGKLFGALYRFYFTQLLPKLGGIISGDGDAYSYLPRTVLAWPSPDEFQAEFEELGLTGCGHEMLTRGIACLHWGRVPDRA